MDRKKFWDEMEKTHNESWKQVGEIIEGYKGLEKPKMIDELLKGGFKKGEFVNLFSYTGKGASYINITHPDIDKDKN